MAKKPARTDPSAPLAYTTRRGVTYYLHEGKTSRGNRRLFMAKSVGPGWLAALPDGYALRESVNGVVSVTRQKGSSQTVPAADVELVRRELRRHAKSRECEVDVRGCAIVVHEPVGLSAEDLAESAALGFGMVVRPDVLDSLRRRRRFSPVLKFERDDDVYQAFRMTYRGEGGWWPLRSGALQDLVRRYAGHIGEESFFELL